MLKRGFLVLILVVTATIGFTQNEVGAFLMPLNYTRIINSADVDNPQYDTKHTFSRGFGVNFIHFFKGKKDTRKNNRMAFRGDVTWAGHSQAWEATYRTGQTTLQGDDILATWEGKKRLDYIKIAPQFEMSIPLGKHLSVIYFVGPQISFLVDVDGGILVWEDRGVYDYFDLPPADRAYYKSITFDITGGVGFDYEYSKWINLTGGFRGDFSLTKVENPDASANGYDFSYNLELERGGSHNLSVGFFVGVEYTIHKPQFAKTRF